MIDKMTLFADYFSENANWLVPCAVGITGGAIGWLTKLTMTLTRIESRLDYVVQSADSAGKASTSARESIVAKIDGLDARIRSIELNQAHAH